MNSLRCSSTPPTGGFCRRCKDTANVLQYASARGSPEL